MPWRPKPNNRVYRLIVRTGLLMRWIFQIRVIVSGQENLLTPDPLNGASRRAVPGRGAVIAITHFGYLDFAFAELVLWKHARAQMRFMIHQGAADHWFAGPVISATGHVVVGYKSGTAAYDSAVAKLRAGEYIAVLPEAGVSRSFKVRECKTGAARMAAEAGVPVVPVSVWGAHRLMTRGHGFSPRIAWKAPVRVHVGEPLTFPEDADADTTTATLRTELQKGIDAGIADFPVTAEPGAWWMPADHGGGAPTEEERQRLDADDAERGRRRGPKGSKPLS